MYSDVFFDIDGTILDTVFDINLALNESLRVSSYPYIYNIEETKQLVGGGARNLIVKALHNPSEQEIVDFNKVYLPLYIKYQNQDTCPFPGIVDLFTKLNKKGINIYVISNKPQEATIKVIKHFFPTIKFSLVQGKIENVPPKPNPESLNCAINKFNLDKSKVLYVGDSIYDVLYSQNAGVDSLIVTWGYGDIKAFTAQPNYFASKAEDIYSIILK